MGFNSINVEVISPAIDRWTDEWHFSEHYKARTHADIARTFDTAKERMYAAVPEGRAKHVQWQFFLGDRWSPDSAMSIHWYYHKDGRLPKYGHDLEWMESIIQRALKEPSDWYDREAA